MQLSWAHLYFTNPPHIAHARLIPICTTRSLHHTPPLPASLCHVPIVHVSPVGDLASMTDSSRQPHQDIKTRHPRRPIQGPERADFSFGPACQQTPKGGIWGGRHREKKRYERFDAASH
ncbi:hypothetical protein B0T18DRAFT_418356 [Schizothecium vesticola]|uniref:Uncharacterized protein n=1 Tax=Schizothecium vesticola TaxID=314040 RepID=A0AA40EJR6_9PEZI|nr:hypothetical protein B0T18DRAFT_418356 [Schizothecium vesticola]